MEYHYTVEKNIQILVALMKEHKVRKIIASPGSTNITFVASLKQDPYFEIYSAPDERSAAYMACGLAAESGEPVVLSCTGATASRNYVPGLTEAYYRKLPVLAETSTQHIGQIGQYVPQVIDRTVCMNDMVNLSIQVPIIHDKTDEWATNVALNNALLELRHRGGGPVHINLTTSYPLYPIDFSAKELPKVRSIFRIEYGQEMPNLVGKRIGVFVGNHEVMSKDLVLAIDRFCEKYNAVVLCDHTSNYLGQYGMSASLVVSQDLYSPNCSKMDILLHIGQVSGAYLNLKPEEVWRISPDGVLRDTFRKLKYVFEMAEKDFFEFYVKEKELSSQECDYYTEWKNEYDRLMGKIQEIPFSNVWIAQQTLCKLPSGSCLHLGILNSLRSWNFFPIRKDLFGFSNTGGFGIDGLMSSLVGGALSNQKLHFQVIGDLAFFYDMNVLGNKHLPSTVRILLINNGKGTEFRNYTHFASEFGDEADDYFAAGGHYGNKSSKLVKHYAEDLGFEYMSASTKEEYLNVIEKFCLPEVSEKPMLLEVFTTNEDENDALHIMRNLGSTQGTLVWSKAKKRVKEVIGKDGVKSIKKLIGRE